MIITDQQNGNKEVKWWQSLLHSSRITCDIKVQLYLPPAFFLSPNCMQPSTSRAFRRILQPFSAQSTVSSSGSCASRHLTGRSCSRLWTFVHTFREIFGFTNAENQKGKSYRGGLQGRMVIGHEEIKASSSSSLTFGTVRIVQKQAVDSFSTWSWGCF